MTTGSTGRPEEPDTPPSRDHRTPRRIWLAWAILLLFSAAGWMRAVDAWRDRSWLAQAGVQPAPVYLVISGALWGLAGLSAVVGLTLRLPRANTAALVSAGFIALTFWIDRLLFSRAPGSTGNTLFALLVTVLLLGYAVFALLSPSERDKLLRRG